MMDGSVASASLFCSVLDIVSFSGLDATVVERLEASVGEKSKQISGCENAM